MIGTRRVNDSYNFLGNLFHCDHFSGRWLGLSGRGYFVYVLYHLGSGLSIPTIESMRVGVDFALVDGILHNIGAEGQCVLNEVLGVDKMNMKGATFL